MTLCLGSPPRFDIFEPWSSLLLDLINSQHQHQALLQRTLDTLAIIFSIYLLTPRKTMIRGRTNLWKFHTYWSSQHLSHSHEPFSTQSSPFLLPTSISCGPAVLIAFLHTPCQTLAKLLTPPYYLAKHKPGGPQTKCNEQQQTWGSAPTEHHLSYL